MDPIQEQLEKANQLMEKALAHTKKECSKIRAGRAMPDMVDSVQVSYYDQLTPLSQLAAITSPDPRTLVIKPWEKRLLAEIEKALVISKLGLQPQNDGEVIRMVVPALTEERRKELVKQVKQESEKGKIAIRNIRKDSKDSLKNLQKEGLPEDEIKIAEGKLQTLTDDYIEQVDKILLQKEKEIMAV